MDKIQPGELPGLKKMIQAQKAHQSGASKLAESKINAEKAIRATLPQDSELNEEQVAEFVSRAQRAHELKVASQFKEFQSGISNAVTEFNGEVRGLWQSRHELLVKRLAKALECPLEHLHVNGLGHILEQSPLLGELKQMSIACSPTLISERTSAENMAARVLSGYEALAKEKARVL